MALEKCHFCKYGDGVLEHAELVVERCHYHAYPDRWDPTIENQEARAEKDLLGPGEPAPALELAPEQQPVEAPCPDCSHGIICAKHMGRQPYSPPTVTDEVFDPAKALALGFEAEDLAVLVDDEAPHTPRDKSPPTVTPDHRKSKARNK